MKDKQHANKHHYTEWKPYYKRHAPPPVGISGTQQARSGGSGPTVSLAAAEIWGEKFRRHTDMPEYTVN